jgi:hypothetical protein
MPCLTICMSKSAVAGALHCLAAPMVRLMPLRTALTPSEVVGGSIIPASLWRCPMAAALRPMVEAFRP